MNDAISMLKLTVITALGVIAAYFNVLLSIDDCEGIYVENNNGTLTIKAITNSPTENITVQLVVYEVETLS